MTISTRGRCSGSGPRPARRFSVRARLQRRIGLLLLGLGLGDRLFEILQGEIELVGIELFRAPAELHPLQLADQVAQPVILAGELIALVDKPCLLGALGIALGPGRDEHRAQRGDVVRQRLGGRVHGPIGPCNQRLVALSETASRSAAAHPATLGRGTLRRVHPPPIQPVEQRPTGISPVVRLTKRRSTKSRFWTRGIPFTGDPSACFAARPIAGATSRLPMKSNIVMDQVS